MEKGKFAGTIQTLQSLLGDEVQPDAELIDTDATALNEQIAELRQRLRDRQA